MVKLARVQFGTVIFQHHQDHLLILSGTVVETLDLAYVFMLRLLNDYLRDRLWRVIQERFLGRWFLCRLELDSYLFVLNIVFIVWFIANMLRLFIGTQLLDAFRYLLIIWLLPVWRLIFFPRIVSRVLQFCQLFSSSIYALITRSFRCVIFLITIPNELLFLEVILISAGYVLEWSYFYVL